MDRTDPILLLAGQVTVSDRIRALHRGGYSRAEIARLLNKRYQHVRNVLVDDERRPTHLAKPMSPPPQAHDVSGVSETAAAYSARPRLAQAERLVWMDVTAQGTLTFPESVRAALDTSQYGRVLAEIDDDGTVRLLSVPAAVRQAQAIVRPYLPPGVNAVDEFLADRRAEAERENRGD